MILPMVIVTKQKDNRLCASQIAEKGIVGNSLLTEEKKLNGSNEGGEEGQMSYVLRFYKTGMGMRCQSSKGGEGWFSINRKKKKKWSIQLRNEYVWFQFTFF